MNIRAPIWSWIQRVYQRLKNIRSSPHEIAKAFAVGVFIGVLPGTGLAVALVIAVFFKLNKTAIALGALTNNPWTTPFIYAASYKMGLWIIASKIHLTWREILSWHGFTFKKLGIALTPFLVGGFALAVVCGIAAYALVYCAMIWYKRSRLRR